MIEPRVVPDLSQLIYRELEPKEAERLPHLAPSGALLYDGTFRVMGAISPEGEIIATTGIMQLPLWEGYWVEKRYRGLPDLKTKLALHVHAMLRSAEMDGAFAIAPESHPAVRQAIEDQKGVYVGRLYMIPTQKE